MLEMQPPSSTSPRPEWRGRTAVDPAIQVMFSRPEIVVQRESLAHVADPSSHLAAASALEAARSPDPTGGDSPMSILIAVLPAPFAPRNPKTSPFHVEGDAVTP